MTHVLKAMAMHRVVNLGDNIGRWGIGEDGRDVTWALQSRKLARGWRYRRLRPCGLWSKWMTTSDCFYRKVVCR